MRFACDGCNAKYMISDDKVGPGGVKVRCKKCGHVILVRHPEPDVEGAAGAGVGLGAEWWVAIADQPVGPVAIEVVQHHWDAGEIGPESLVWYAGLAEWSPLSSVPELHAYLLGTVPPPPPDLPGTEAPDEFRAPVPPEPEPESLRPGDGPDAFPGPAPVDEPFLREPLAAASQAHPGVGLGVDPTGVVPLPIQGLERTGEKRIARTPGAQGPRARASVSARRPEKSRSLTVALVVALVVVAALAAGLWWIAK
jgi:predicted Zn finger-like uncharacterized protein